MRRLRKVTGMAADVIDPAVMPPEAWERVRDAMLRPLRARLRDAGTARALARARRVVLWGAPALVLAMVVVFPRYRDALQAYVACFWILLLWFAVARTKTVTWGSVARMFAVGVVWSWVIAWTSFRLVELSGVGVNSAGPGTAIAAFAEESLKLVPLAVVAIVAPGRARRFAAVDWLLLGLAAGLGFQAWEDLVRRLVRAVNGPTLSDVIALTRETGHGSPEYGWGLLSGGSSLHVGDQVFGWAGHHVTTALVAGAVGLGIAAWRRGRGGSAWWHVAAAAAPAVAMLLVLADHFGYNAVLRDSRWTDDTEMSSPWLLRATWSLTQGTGRGWLLLLVLVAALAVDGRRLHPRGSPTDLARHATRDVVTILAAHARQGDEHRRDAVRRGRAAVAMLREARLRAMAADALATFAGDATLGPDAGPDATTGPGVAGADLVRHEVSARRRTRAVALVVLAVLLVLGLVVAAALAQRIGRDLTPAPDVRWLAGQFDGLGQWWSERSGAEKVLIGAAIAGLVVASGGSFGLALGVAGAGTYVAAHGRGVASLIRDPSGATRSYVDTTSPGMMALDGAELGMTFLPGGFGGASGRSAREAAEAYARTGADDAARVGRGAVDDVARGRGGVTSDTARGATGTDDALPALDPADLRALHDYTGPGYGEMNVSLRNGGPLGGTELAERVEAVSAALAKLPKYDGVVFRGTYLTDKQIAAYVPGEIVTERAFISTSVDPAAKFPGNVEFVIESRSGRDIAAYSRVPTETEVLFDRNTTFEVRYNVFDESTGKTLITMAEVP
jgi:hypothetical protein